MTDVAVRRCRGALELRVDQRLGDLGREKGREYEPGGRMHQRHHRAGTQVDVYGVSGFLEADDRRPVRSPHGERRRLPDAVREGGDLRRRDAHRLEPLQARESHLESEGAQFVAAGRRILVDQAELAEAHEVRMRLRRRHAGLAREIAQHHRRPAAAQRGQQLPADLDRLNAATFLVHGAPSRRAGGDAGEGPVGRIIH
jgi:hypothetical protein